MLPDYSASKGAIQTLTKAMAKMLADTGNPLDKVASIGEKRPDEHARLKPSRYGRTAPSILPMNSFSGPVPRIQRTTATMSWSQSM
jgi:NAD(P)-dependent dehydrogenase (short-subunit alcohol dehydrogenase family)